MGNPRLRVSITGAAGYIGDRLVRRLEEEDDVEFILATDVRSTIGGYGPKVSFQHYDVTEPMGSMLSDHNIDSLVHLAYVLQPRRNKAAVRRINVDGAAHVLSGCEGAGVRYLLYFSSTSVYGAHQDNPAEFTEQSPPRPIRGFQYSEDKLEAEKLFDEYAGLHPENTVAILRGCPVVGPHADNFIARAFRRPILVGFLGHDPPMQLLHEDDLTEIMVRCVLDRVSGLYNVAGSGTIKWSQMARRLGRYWLRLPAPLLNGLTWASWTLGLQSDSAPPGLSFTRYPWVASTEKIQRALNYTFQHSSVEAWEVFAHVNGGGGVDAPGQYSGSLDGDLETDPVETREK